jgi:hypothetical protein
MTEVPTVRSRSAVIDHPPPRLRAMSKGHLSGSKGGPFSRRRDKRQLEHLAESSDRDVARAAAAAHVKVIEDHAEASNRERETDKPDPEDEGPLPIRTGGFHVRAVPIDQPIGE